MSLNNNVVEETFEKELEHLINKYSKENGSDTPDFILAQFLSQCLNAFNQTLAVREKWHGRELSNHQEKMLNES